MNFLRASWHVPIRLRRFLLRTKWLNFEPDHDRQGSSQDTVIF
jgi:hypothetical protein